jgi:hypothetical protein
MIAARYILHPVESAAAVGMVFSSALGMTIARVGFGGFPLACSLFTLSCLVSRRRVFTGLTFVATVLGVVLGVRLFGMAIDGTVRENMHLVRAETIMLVLFAIAIFLESVRRRREVAHAI